MLDAAACFRVVLFVQGLAAVLVASVNVLESPVKSGAKLSKWGSLSIFRRRLLLMGRLTVCPCVAWRGNLLLRDFWYSGGLWKRGFYVGIQL